MQPPIVVMGAYGFFKPTGTRMARLLARRIPNRRDSDLHDERSPCGVVTAANEHCAFPAPIYFNQASNLARLPLVHRNHLVPRKQRIFEVYVAVAVRAEERLVVLAVQGGRAGAAQLAGGRGRLSQGRGHVAPSSLCARVIRQQVLSAGRHWDGGRRRIAVPSTKSHRFRMPGGVDAFDHGKHSSGRKLPSKGTKRLVVGAGPAHTLRVECCWRGAGARILDPPETAHGLGSAGLPEKQRRRSELAFRWPL